MLYFICVRYTRIYINIIVHFALRHIAKMAMYYVLSDKQCCSVAERYYVVITSALTNSCMYCVCAYLDVYVRAIMRVIACLRLGPCVPVHIMCAWLEQMVVQIL